MGIADIERINGAVKVLYQNGSFEYQFQNGARAIVKDNALDWDSDGARWIAFSDLADPGVSTTMEEYVDAICVAGTADAPPVTISTAGLATSVLQTTGNASLSSIDTKVATSALQTTGNGFLSTIATWTANAATSALQSALNALATTANALQTTANSYLLGLSQTIATDATPYSDKSLQVSFDPDFVTNGVELMVAQLVSQLGAKQTQSDLPLFYSRVSSGGATQTYDGNNAETVMAVTANGQYAIAQTLMRFQYNAGQTKMSEITFNNFQIVANVVKRVGYFNGGEVAPHTTFDGIFLEMDGTTYQACYAKNGTVTRVPRSAWRDKLDGTGPSGITVDWSKFQALRINFLWLGGTGVEFSLIIGRQLITFCEIQLSNIIAQVFILKPNQPVRYEIRSTGGTATFGQICAMVGNIGVNGVEGIPSGFASPAPITLPTAGTTYMLGAIRKRAGFLSVDIKLGEFDLLSTATSNDNYYYFVILNPTIAGVVTWVTGDGAIEHAIGIPTNTVTGGKILHSGTGTQGLTTTDIPPSVIRPGSSVTGTADVFAICARIITNNVDLGIAFNAIEFQ